MKRNGIWRRQHLHHRSLSSSPSSSRVDARIDRGRRIPVPPPPPPHSLKAFFCYSLQLLVVLSNPSESQQPIIRSLSVLISAPHISRARFSLLEEQSRVHTQPSSETTEAVKRKVEREERIRYRDNGDNLSIYISISLSATPCSSPSSSTFTSRS